MAKTNFPKERQVVDKKTGRKSFSCYNCDYTVYYKSNLIRHMKQHDKKSKFIASVPDKHNRCIHCNAVFKNKITVYDHIATFKTNIALDIVKNHPDIPDTTKLTTCIHCGADFKSKLSLDDHVLRVHPSLAASVNRKVLKCTKKHLERPINGIGYKHTSRHPKSRSIEHCIHCEAIFSNKTALDDHIVKNHPNFISSIGRKIYECTKCNYKTTFKNNFERHNVSVHTASLLNEKLMCIHCKESFKSKESLDEHIVRNHPEFITSVGRKIYECIQCTYKTVLRANFLRHTSIHLKGGSNDKLPRCIHCNKTFNSRIALDNHVVRKHPDFITSVHRKIYECTKCSYKTTLRNTFERHNTLVHPDSNLKLNVCIHCTESFKSKESLDGHIVRKHPDFITSVDRKIYECTKCEYKTIMKSHFDMHTSIHPGNASSCKIRQCIHCNATFKSNRALDSHVVKVHPYFISSVGRKVYECTKCVYKTTFKNNFERHVVVHPESA
nr:unnamed protein product [Callosobruchus chinensis]